LTKENFKPKDPKGNNYREEEISFGGTLELKPDLKPAK
jgi:hypothetical protein